MSNINILELPEEIKEGDVLTYKNGIYEINYDKRTEIEERIKEKMKNLFEED